MHGVAHAVARVVNIKFLRLVLHEQRMPALMERGEDVGDEVFLVIVRRDAHVVRAEAVGERVFGGHQHQR